MIFKFKKEIIIFFTIFLLVNFFVYLLLNGGAYLKILRYYLSLQSVFAEYDTENKSYYLYIPKIEVSVPIIFPENNSIQGILSSLEKGAGLYPGFQLPGQFGQSVILGHSSKTSWYSGEYAYIFALLNKLQNEDEFYIVSKNDMLVYRVFASNILTPEQTNDLILKTPKNESNVILITCWPIGFSSKRVVIQARLDRIEEI